jgi:hypothetical protein
MTEQKDVAQLTDKQLEAQGAKAEKLRLTTLLLKNQASMAADYKNTIKHTGGLLTQSMVYAYSKALNDAFKLLTRKEQ